MYTLDGTIISDNEVNRYFINPSCKFSLELLCHIFGATDVSQVDDSSWLFLIMVISLPVSCMSCDRDKITEKQIFLKTFNLKKTDTLSSELVKL